jgi:hypothetical protein
VLRLVPVYQTLMASADRVKRFPAQDSWEMRSWQSWLEEVRSGKRRACAPKRYLDRLALMRIIGCLELEEDAPADLAEPAERLQPV